MIKTDKYQKSFSIALIALVGYQLLISFMSGFRWPSDYILTNHVISYRQGFLPRSLVGAIGYAIFGVKWYSWKYMSVVIMLTGLIFVLWICALLLKSGYDFNNPALFVIIAAFAISPYAKYYLHEMGYYEQYGYVLLILLVYACKKDSTWRTYILPAIVGFIALLISESNMFLIVPVTFAFSFITIMNSKKGKDIIKSTLYLFLTYIPHIIYSILIFEVKVPLEKIIAIQSYDRAMVNASSLHFNFNFREDVHLYMSGDRSNADSWGRALRPIPIWCVAMTALLIIFVAYCIYRSHHDKKLVFSYALSAVAVALADYSIMIVAWDLERFYFTIFISVLFVSIYTLKKYEIKNIPTGEFLLISAIFILAYVGMSSNRLGLFDEAVYNNTWNDFLNVVFSRIKG